MTRHRHSDPWLAFFANTKRAQSGPVISGVRCLEWTAGKARGGYGKMRGNHRTERAHRWSYATFVRDPGSKLVCHKCDNPCCVEPAHLFAGTHADNHADMDVKGRRRNAQAAKLSDADVARIRSLKGTMSQREIGRLFGVTGQAVNLIHNNQRRSQHQPSTP